jgi:hypothetical protein
MRKRFVVATNATTALEDQAFKDTLKATFPGLGWWHRLDELWLITDDQGRLDARQLRDIAKECFSRKKLLVLEINDDGDTWSGLGPAGRAKEMFAWLHTYWKDE